MTKQPILLKEALAIMDSGEPFAISFVTLDRKRKTGGKLIKIPSAVESGAKTKEKQEASAAAAGLVGTPKKPNHKNNRTRNVILLPNKRLRKVNIRLITELNNHPVIW